MEADALGAREAARRQIENILSEKSGESSDEASFDAVSERLRPEDRGLFQELVQGSLREWRFLETVLGELAKRPPRQGLKTIALLSAYQLLFLERVPAYAVFAEAGVMARKIGASEPELKFMHGVLKSVERAKTELLARRSKVLEQAATGECGESPFELAVLNAGPGLLDTLTVVEIKGQRKLGRKRAVRALGAMKERARLVGYALSRQTPTAANAPLGSSIAPDSLVFEAGPELRSDLSEGRARIQGEASQWVCILAAEVLKLMASAQTDKRPLRVLEMATGKGGKLLGTLTALERKLGRAAELPEIEWFAVDSSSRQIGILERDTLPVAERLWPRVKTTAYATNWEGDAFANQRFDFIWLDAPCSGFGTLSKLPQIALTRGGEEAFEHTKTMAALQKQLALAGCGLLAPKGQFFYTVCTMSWPETWGVLDALKSSVALGAPPFCIQTFSLWPGSPPAPQAEGFFAALVEK